MVTYSEDYGIYACSPYGIGVPDLVMKHRLEEGGKVTDAYYYGEPVYNSKPHKTETKPGRDVKQIISYFYGRKP